MLRPFWVPHASPQCHRPGPSPTPTPVSCPVLSPDASFPCAIAPCRPLMLTVPQSISPTPSSDAVPGTPRVASPGSRATILSRGFKNKEAPRRSWLGGSVLALEGRAAARLPSTAAWPGPARGRGGWRRAGKARGPTALRPPPPPAPPTRSSRGGPGPGARVSVTPAPSAPTDLRPIRPPQAGTASNAEATPREPPRPSLTSGFSGASETRETRLCRWRVPRCPRPRSAARRTPRASSPAEAPAVHSGSDFFTENGFERGGRSGINTDLLKRRSCLIPPPDSAADFTGQKALAFAQPRPLPPGNVRGRPGGGCLAFRGDVTAVGSSPTGFPGPGPSALRDTRRPLKDLRGPPASHPGFEHAPTTGPRTRLCTKPRSRKPGREVGRWIPGKSTRSPPTPRAFRPTWPCDTEGNGHYKSRYKR